MYCYSGYYEIMNIILSIIIGYTAGSIPNALIIGKLFYNTDVRHYGSGNLGGSNTGRVLGAKAGLPVMILDVLKIIIAMSVVYYLYTDINCLLICGLAANIGHCYPIFARFTGGKAVSTFIGYLIFIALFVLNDIFIFIIPISAFLIILFITKIVSISSILSSLIISLYLYINIGFTPIFIVTFILSLFLSIRHKTNIIRLLNHNENKITWM